MIRPNFDKDHLPIAGILAFSGCSVSALAHLFFSRAVRGTWLFWAAALLVELCTAWLIWSVVETARKVTKSNISRQDKRFYSTILVTFLILAIPPLAVSVIANTIEFGGDVLLGSLFPTLSIACAVGAGLPETIKKHESQRQVEASQKQAERKQRQAERKKVARAEQEEARKRQERGKLLASLGNAEATFVKLCQDPTQSQASIAQDLSISRQAVGQHLNKLEELGAIERGNGQGVVILWDAVDLEPPSTEGGIA